MPALTSANSSQVAPSSPGNQEGTLRSSSTLPIVGISRPAAAASNEATDTGPQMLFSREGWLWFGLTMSTLGGLALGMVDFMAADAWWLHGAWCAMGLAAVLPILWKTVRIGVTVILYDHVVMFTLAFAVYFLFGALLLAIGPREQIDQALSYYPIDARGAMRADAVNAIGFGVAIGAAALSRGRWLAACADQVAIVASKVPADLTVFLLLLVGVLGWLNALSVDLGLREGIVAGAWRTLSNLPLVAIFLGVAHNGHRQRLLRFVSVVVALGLALVGLLLLTKTGILLPLAALVAGLAIRYSSRAVLPLGIATLGGIFVLVGGLVSSSRQALTREVKRDVATYQTVFEEGMANDDPYQPWGRLCYVAPQVAGLDFYDAGVGGDDFRLIPWLFVPRALVSSKPNITQTSADFHTKISGNEGSSTGQGVFTNGYYNGGWVGLFAASMLCGWVLAQTSAIARAIVARRALLLLPFVLLGVHIGFRIDGHFVSDYLGAFIFILYPLAFGAFVMGARRRRLDT